MGLKLHGVVGLNLKMIVTMWSGMYVVQREPCVMRGGTYSVL